jgi:hypothetical protein
MTKTGFQMFEQNLQKRIITQQQYLEDMRDCARCLFADYEQCVVADVDVAWLREHHHIVNPPAADSLANRMRTNQPRSCKLVGVRMECTGWTVVRGFALWVGIFLELWRVDGWVIIWNFLVMFWFSFWCFVYFIITSFTMMHEGLC